MLASPGKTGGKEPAETKRVPLEIFSSKVVFHPLCFPLDYARQVLRRGCEAAADLPLSDSSAWIADAIARLEGVMVGGAAPLLDDEVERRRGDDQVLACAHAVRGRREPSQRARRMLLLASNAVRRIEQGLATSEYVNRSRQGQADSTVWDDAGSVYKTDCSGFIDAVYHNACGETLPPRFLSDRSYFRCKDWWNFLDAADAEESCGWARVPLSEVIPGDVVTWKTPDQGNAGRSSFTAGPLSHVVDQVALATALKAAGRRRGREAAAQRLSDAKRSAAQWSASVKRRLLSAGVEDKRQLEALISGGAQDCPLNVALDSTLFLSAGAEAFDSEAALRELLERTLGGGDAVVTALDRGAGGGPFRSAGVRVASGRAAREVVEACERGRLRWKGQRLSAARARRVGAEALRLLESACRTPFRHTGHIVMAASYAEGGASADGSEIVLHTLESTGSGGFGAGRKSGLQCFRRRFAWREDRGEWVWAKSLDEPSAPGWGVVRVGRPLDA